MTNRDDRPAFPTLAQEVVADNGNRTYTFVNEGMTLRQFYAGLMMAASRVSNPFNVHSHTIAKLAWEDADALIAAEEEATK